VGELQAMVDPLRRARDTALETVRWVAGFEFPDFEPDYEFVALRHPSEYAMNEGRLVSTRGLDIAIDAFGEHFVERHVAHSNALHCVLRERGSYQVGPLARFNLNHDQLSQGARAAAAECRLVAPCRNPFRSIVARAVELVHACEEALEIIERYEPPPAPRAVVQARAGVGHGCTEAPRGILYHRYEVNGEGDVVKAWIVPPTSQNQKRIEDDLREFVPSVAALGDEELTWRCEQMVRNYDPCISCATHSLKTTVVRV
jgi:coenzyme F420-reducing hydrogenase alpha subunit